MEPLNQSSAAGTGEAAAAGAGEDAAVGAGDAAVSCLGAAGAGGVAGGVAGGAAAGSCASRGATPNARKSRQTRKRRGAVISADPYPRNFRGSSDDTPCSS